MFISGGKIDHAHHESYGKKAIYETIEFSNAVEKAVQMTDEQETLIVVTADHSHTFTMGGYASWKAPMLGVIVDSIKFLTKGYRCV